MLCSNTQIHFITHLTVKKNNRIEKQLVQTYIIDYSRQTGRTSHWYRGQWKGWWRQSSEEQTGRNQVWAGRENAWSWNRGNHLTEATDFCFYIKTIKSPLGMVHCSVAHNLTWIITTGCFRQLRVTLDWPWLTLGMSVFYVLVCATTMYTIPLRGIIPFFLINRSVFQEGTDNPKTKLLKGKWALNWRKKGWASLGLVIIIIITAVWVCLWPFIQ